MRPAGRAASGSRRKKASWPGAYFSASPSSGTSTASNRIALTATAVATSGVRVIRFTYEDVVERPAYVVATLGAFLGLPVAA